MHSNNTNWEEVESILRSLDTASKESRRVLLATLSLEADYQEALILAVEGNLTELNRKVFSLGSEYDGPIIWLSPLPCATDTLAWFCGTQHPLSMQVHQAIGSSNRRVAEHYANELANTPPILFYIPTASSDTQYSLEEGEDEFGVFQEQLGDRSKRLILNVPQLALDRLKAIRRAIKFFPSYDFSLMEENIDLLILLNSEGHNRGHFYGPWPLDEVKGGVQVYEPLEELRSCLIAVHMAELAGYEQYIVDMLAFNVLVTRFFGYGYEAYHGDLQLIENFREVTAGAILWEWLRKDEVIQFDDTNSGTCVLCLPKLRPSFANLLEEIHVKESVAKSEGQSALDHHAGQWFELAFPGADFSLEVKKIYTKGGD